MDETTTNKTLLWAVSCLAFNGCIRIHKLLARTADQFDANSTLLLKDVKIVGRDGDTSKEIHIRLKSPEEDRIGKGKIIDIYETIGTMFPVHAYERWTRLSKFEDKILPLFRLENGANLTGRRFNKILKHLLSKHLDYSKGTISSHSFKGVGHLNGTAGVPRHRHYGHR